MNFHCSNWPSQACDENSLNRKQIYSMCVVLWVCEQSKVGVYK